MGIPTTYLNAHGLQLHWIAPDGRCVFGAIAHIAGMSTAQAIQSTLTLLQASARRAGSGRVRRTGTT